MKRKLGRPINNKPINSKLLKELVRSKFDRHEPLAEIIGCTCAQITAWTNDYCSPNKDRMKQFAELFNVPIAVFYMDDDKFNESLSKIALILTESNPNDRDTELVLYAIIDLLNNLSDKQNLTGLITS